METVSIDRFKPHTGEGPVEVSQPPRRSWPPAPSLAAVQPGSGGASSFTWVEVTKRGCGQLLPIQPLSFRRVEAEGGAIWRLRGRSPWKSSLYLYRMRQFLVGEILQGFIEKYCSLVLAAMGVVKLRLHMNKWYISPLTYKLKGRVSPDFLYSVFLSNNFFLSQKTWMEIIYKSWILIELSIFVIDSPVFHHWRVDYLNSIG